MRRWLKILQADLLDHLDLYVLWVFLGAAVSLEILALFRPELGGKFTSAVVLTALSALNVLLYSLEKDRTARESLSLQTLVLSSSVAVISQRLETLDRNTTSMRVLESWQSDEVRRLIRGGSEVCGNGG
jgi:hypothetical protein